MNAATEKVRKYSREDLYHLEDEEYRAYLRGQLHVARRNLANRNRSHTGIITLLLFMLMTVIGMHEMGWMKILP
jgi:hypothetical protein